MENCSPPLVPYYKRLAFQAPSGSWPGGCPAPGVRPCALTWDAGGGLRGDSHPQALLPSGAGRRRAFPGAGWTPRRAPLASSRPGPTEAHPPGAPRRPSPRRHPLSNRRGALRGAGRAPTRPRVHHARAPRPRGCPSAPRAARAAGAAEPGARTWRPRARERRSLGASEPGCRRRRFRVGGSRVTATGLRTAPAERGSGAGAGGERRARNHYKRKRRREEEEEALCTFAKPSRRPSHKRRTPADAPPPAPGPRRIVGPASAVRGAPGPPRAGPHPKTGGAQGRGWAGTDLRVRSRAWAV